MGGDPPVPIRRDADIVEARRQGRLLGEALGLSVAELAMVATAISEVARNILHHAGEGEIVLRRVDREGTEGLQVIARDRGPGIADVDHAFADGTASGLGLGLPGARRLMDDLVVETSVGEGTTVTMTKWARGK